MVVGAPPRGRAQRSDVPSLLRHRLAATVIKSLRGQGAANLRPVQGWIIHRKGTARLGDAQFAAACAELEKLKGKGLGPRDLGLPAARACVQSGDADAAVAWLGTIPSRFLPPQVENEAVFAPLRSREDFRALFRR